MVRTYRLSTCSSKSVILFSILKMSISSWLKERAIVLFRSEKEESVSQL